jgi:dienelactone hydrolase
MKTNSLTFLLLIMIAGGAGAGLSHFKRSARALATQSEIEDSRRKAAELSEESPRNKHAETQPQPVLAADPATQLPSPSARSERQPDEKQPGYKSKTLSEARRGFTPRFTRKDRAGDALETPPTDVFRAVKYASTVGELDAYLTPAPTDGEKHPAIVWITGGDCNTIGNVWDPPDPKDDQSASAYRAAGIVMLFPSLRGGNQNPGFKEGFYGEVDDVIAAGDFLAQQPYVDPQRIYLGGHSSGGTLTLLVAESTDRFRAVFSFGPIANIAAYLPFDKSGPVALPFDHSDRMEMMLRSPMLWLSSITRPTYVIEGERGNSDQFEQLQTLGALSGVANLHFLSVKGADHFSVLSPINRMIARGILTDNGPHCAIRLSATEFAQTPPR